MADSNDRLKVDELMSSRWSNAPAEEGPCFQVVIQQAQTNSTLPVVSTAQVAPISVSPSVYAANTPLENGKEVSRADVGLAKRHLMVTSCTVRDREKDTYAWRSIWGTSRADMQQRKNNTTPSDYAIHVMGLPRQLGNSPEEHHRYADKLKEHFERLVGDMPAEELAGRDPNQPVVCEVALARDYQGAVRNFLGQGKLYVRKYELEAQMSALQSRGKIVRGV
ncbi:hypothetical protein Pmar_PMAR015597 [Perkinsus marinus ATCC 50983]|uniref:Uncharacterized protein n=1 Tax=Perkinsus marinus (strain ATCC 50983 / TXsc) TaxID=423536 RepID=C5KUK2_PERM5|nr:hypothetical protein Pmar_PMAR015597 [Perkinsus marinus ATCC 50983]EER11889.1 hypothetical protein Pmar_PMAR015597 [Perkinsus marinus ATCC 50983]|eukprot:XP_002780094.1 hypothetical protein Pmar_PMAR015597 [Perkinsus marinus ATCC 50983]